MRLTVIIDGKMYEGATVQEDMTAEEAIGSMHGDNRTGSLKMKLKDGSWALFQPELVKKAIIIARD